MGDELTFNRMCQPSISDDVSCISLQKGNLLLVYALPYNYHTHVRKVAHMVYQNLP